MDSAYEQCWNNAIIDEFNNNKYMYVNVGVINTVTDEPSILSQLSLSNNVTARVMNAVTIDAINTITARRQLQTANDSDME